MFGHSYGTPQNRSCPANNPNRINNETALDHYRRSDRLNRLAPSACAPVGERGSVAVPALEKWKARRTSPARIRIVIFAGGSAAEIPQAAAAVRTRLHGSGASLESEPVQAVCFSARDCRARAPQLFRKAERTGHETPGGHCAARGILEAQPAIPSNLPYHRRSCGAKHELAGRLPRRSAPRQRSNSLELVRSVPQAGLCGSGRPSSLG